MAAIIKGSNMFVGNDSGPLHIAIALKVPALGIFGFTAPEQLIPPRAKHVIVKKPSQKVIYTHQPFLRLGRNAGKPIEAVSVKDVLDAVDEIFNKGKITPE
jgi:ADP-heptose:LPS heptosyltransferase